MAGFASTLALRPEHGYVVGALIFSAFVPVYASTFVMKARKDYGIEYPTMYAPTGHKNEKEFNCAQRAHQNILENLANHYLLTILAGVHRPVYAAAACMLRALGFVVYCRGYNTGNPAKRQQGSFGYIGLFANLFMAIELAYRLLAEK